MVSFKNLTDRDYFHGNVVLVVPKNNHNECITLKKLFMRNFAIGSFEASIKRERYGKIKYFLMDTFIKKKDWTNEHCARADEVGAKQIIRLRDVTKTYSETKELLRYLFDNNYEYSIKWGNTNAQRIEFIDLILKTNDPEETSLMHLLW